MLRDLLSTGFNSYLLFVKICVNSYLNTNLHKKNCQKGTIASIETEYNNVKESVAIPFKDAKGFQGVKK